MLLDAVSYTDFSSVITAITDQISVSTIVAVLAAAAGIAIAFVFMWWGIRKVIKIIMSAVRKGKISV